MKEHISNAMRSFVCAMIAAALSALATALLLTLYDAQRTVEMAVGLWAVLLLAQAMVNELLCARDVSRLAYAAANCALLFFGGERIVSATTFIPGSSGFSVLLRILIWSSGLTGAFASQKLPDSNVFVRLGDVLIVSASIYLATAFALDHAFILPILAFAALALVLSMAIASSLRAGGESDSVIRGAGAGGWLVLFLLLALCLLLCGALLSLSGNHVDSLVALLAKLWTILCRAGSLLLMLLARIVALLYPNPRMMERQYVQADSLSYPNGPMEEMANAPDWFLYLILGLIAALLLAGILAILFALRRQKIGRARRKRARRSVTRKSHLLSALRALLRGVGDRITFELAYRTHRQTPQGLYVLARRTCRLKLLPQKKSESAGAYLRRLHTVLLAQGGTSTLDQLGSMLDHVLYAGETIRLTSDEYRAYTAQIRAITFPQRKSP